MPEVKMHATTESKMKTTTRLLDTSQHPTPERLQQFIFGYAPPLMIAAAVHHRVFDVLEAGPKTIEQVSAETGASIRGLRAVMNALVALEFLDKDRQGRYTLTPESAAFLVSGKPGFMGEMFRHTTTNLLPEWMKLNDSVRTGEPADARNREDIGTEFFQTFVEALFPMSYAAAQALGKVLDIAQAKQPVPVLDLAAGSGVWGIALAQQSPQVSVTAVDWAGVIPVTQRVVAHHGLESCFKFIAGDLMEVHFGSGYHIAILGHILHGLGEEQSRALLRKVFDALASGGTIAIAERLANEDRTGPLHSMIFAVNMLVCTDRGDAFSFGEINHWLREAGFTAAQTIAMPGPSPLILATKPQ